jgi:hypothetical protein
MALGAREPAWGFRARGVLFLLDRYPKLVLASGLLMTALVVWLNVQPSQNPGLSGRHDSPFDEYWMSLPRTEYGWPLSFVRDFGTADPFPSLDARFDVMVFALDLVFWCGVFSLIVGGLEGIGRISLRKLAAQG